LLLSAYIYRPEELEFGVIDEMLDHRREKLNLYGILFRPRTGCPPFFWLFTFAIIGWIDWQLIRKELDGIWIVDYGPWTN
jgi:hypothetical protein